jgi:hypothetical protein
MELLNVCISQRRHDSFGRRLRVFHLDELSEMSAAELARVKADGFLSLPDLQQEHAPKVGADGDEIWCPCDACSTARAVWRAESGRD